MHKCVIKRDHKRWRVSLWPMASYRAFVYLDEPFVVALIDRRRITHTHSQPTNLADVCSLSPTHRCNLEHCFIHWRRALSYHTFARVNSQHTLLSIHRIYAVASVYSPYAFVISLCQLAHKHNCSLGTTSANLTKSIPKPLVFALCQKPFARLNCSALP